MTEWTSSWLEYTTVCILGQGDCDPGFFKKPALIMMTFEIRQQFTATLVRYMLLETLLRTLQAFTGGLAWWILTNRSPQLPIKLKPSQVQSAFVRISYILVLLTLAEVIYYAIQYNKVPSLVAEPEEQQMISMVLGVLGVTIVILQRLVIRGCMAVVEIIVRFIQRRLGNDVRHQEEELPTTTSYCGDREKEKEKIF